VSPFVPELVRWLQKYILCDFIIHKYLWRHQRVAKQSKEVND
jgi:hypothetical protein